MKESFGGNIARLGINDINKCEGDMLLLSLEEYCSECGKKVNSPHRISYYQIVLVSDGTGSVWIDSGRHEITHKSLIAAAKGKVVCYDFETVPKGYILLFSDEFINRNPGDIEWINNLGIFNINSSRPVINLSEQEYVELFVYLKKIKSEMEIKEDRITSEIVFSLLKTFVLLTERANCKNNSEEVSAVNGCRYVHEFQKQLEATFYNSRTVNYYAGQLGITPRKLNQATISSCGISAKQMIEDRVLLETKRLLTHTQLTIKEIGHSMGFNDPTNFNKFFKRYVKQTPMEFREFNRKYYKSIKTADIDHFQSITSADN